MPENRAQTTTAGQQNAVARAVEANKQLMDAASKCGSAYFDAYQETALGLPRVPGKFTNVAPLDGSKFAPDPEFPRNDALGDQWQRALGGAIDTDELAAAGKRVCLGWIDSYEKAALAAIDLHERMAEATNLDWLNSMASTRAGIRRDVTQSYFSSVRALLK